MEDKKMKKVLWKLYTVGIGVLPLFIMVSLALNANSVASPINGQPKAPENIKKYRKF